MQSGWTLEELSARVARALRAVGLAEAAQHNGQVSDVPNARTIRYYATIGLLDRPQPRGRAVVYGERQLWQLVAIKRLQAQGKTLVEVQEALAGLDDDALRSLAALPALTDDDLDATVAHGPLERPAPSRRDGAFWSAPIAAIVDEPERARPPPPVDTTLSGLATARGTSLSFPAARALTDDDRRALREALAELEELLIARRLLP